MIDIYNFDSYKEFIRKWVQEQPRRGFGQFKKMADHLGVGTVLISQIFKGDREISEEQALRLCEYVGLLERQTKYFLCLVRIARAGTVKLKKLLLVERDSLRDEAKHLKQRIKSDKPLDDLQQSIFYSDWHYSAVRLATDIPTLRTLSSLAERLDLPVDNVKKTLEFLVEAGLCEIKEGEISMGPRVVYLPADSPWVLSRQRAWRLRGLQKMELKSKEQLFITCPLVCSTKTAEIIKKKVLNLVDEILSEIKDSPSEELQCLNIDWFSI